MTDGQRIGVAHFTNIAHLATIIEHGLLCDDSAKAAGRLQVDVGDHDVKDRRATREVPVSPGGTVSSYVPFYFAARSPMMYKIWRGQVRTYGGGQEPLVYLVSSVQRLMQEGCTLVVTDGNAANNPTKFPTTSPTLGPSSILMYFGQRSGTTRPRTLIACGDAWQNALPMRLYLPQRSNGL